MGPVARMTWMAHYLRDRVWQRRGLVGTAAWWALRPLSGLYAVAVAARAAGYRLGLLRTQRPALPVVSVGNLAAGGTGKTPFALWLAQALMRRGWRPAIVLRGYGGSARAPVLVGDGRQVVSTVEIAGDEAVMLAKRFLGPVIVARRRAEGVAMARAAGCDVAVLDDGFQHRALARDCDVVLVDSLDASLLPAGPLREPAWALGRADAVVRVLRGDSFGGPRYGLRCPVFDARMEATALVESVRGAWQELPLSLLAGQKVAAVSAIAHPEAFHELLRQWEAEIVEIVVFGDHHAYTAADWRRITRCARHADLVLTTEKDLVKLEVFPFARGKLLALRVEPAVERADALLDLVCARARRGAKGGENGDQSGTAGNPGVPKV